MELLLVWGKFAVCVLTIGVAGVQLSRYGDAIADKSGMGGTLIGLAMVATVTSLPELLTGVSAVAVAELPDIAVGEVLGSCVFNLLIFVVLESVHRRESVYSRASHGHVISAGFGAVLIGVTGLFLLWSALGDVPRIGWIGIYTPFILIVYVAALRTSLQYEKRVIEEFVREEPDRYRGLSLTGAVARYVFAAAFVVAAGIWLPFVGDEIAATMHWHQSFVGTLFVAFATSVPELVVTVAALRIGAFDMAIGNLLGSNMFNILVLAIADVAYLDAPILSSVSISHAVSAFSAVTMTGVAVVALLFRPTLRVFGTVTWASMVMVLIYLLNTYILFTYH